MAIIKTTAPGTLLQEISISDKIIEIAEQESTVAAMATFFPQNGQSEFVVDIARNPAGVITEYASVGPVDPTFKAVKFNQKRIASTIEVSTMALNNSAINLAEHCNELLSYRIINGIEAQMFNTGDADGIAGLQNIFLHNSGTTLVEAIEAVSNAGTANVYMDFVKAVAALSKQPEHLNGAVWAISDVTAVSAIVDAYGNSILNFKDIVPGSIGRILGIPAYVISGGFSDTKTTAVLLNPANAYAVAFNPRATLRQIAGDTTQILRQATVFLGELYVDGHVVNPRGIKFVKHA